MGELGLGSVQLGQAYGANRVGVRPEEPRRTHRLSAALCACLALAGPACSLEGAPEALEEREVVALLHGIGRGAASMRKLADRLEVGGYRVENLDYPSTTASIDELLEGLDRDLAVCCADAPRLHFVTYSLGGILVRAYLADENPPHLGRVVMIAPPNRGSEWVDQLGRSWLFEQTFGPVGGELGTEPESLPNRLAPPDFEFGVIAGTAAINPVGSLLIPGDDDGTVAVENTKLAGMSDFLALPHSHSFIMNSPKVAAATLRFLATGRFRKEPADSGELSRD